MTLPTVEQVANAAACVQQSVIADMLRQFAAILAPSDAGRELEKAIAEYEHWSAYAKQYGHIPEAMEQAPEDADPFAIARRFVARIAVLEANAKLGTEIGASLVQRVEELQDELAALKAERGQIEAAERERCAKMMQDWSYPTGPARDNDKRAAAIHALPPTWKG